MNNDNHFDTSDTQRTVRSQQLQMEYVPVQDAPQEQMLMQQQKAAGKACPFCGAVNDQEAVFCAQCGQPISKTTCPHCGAEADPDADFCEVCHKYMRKDVCSYCGARLNGSEAYCPECGSPRGGVVCPTCHTLNDFAFCKKCGTALTEEARQLVKELQQNSDYQELMTAVQEYSKLENSLPYDSERDIRKEQACQQLRERVLTLLAQDEGIADPDIPKIETQRLTKDELEEKKAEQVKRLSAILDKLAIPVTPSPAKARNFAMASKPVGVRLAWVCNFKHAMHSSPCGCAKPQMGGKWVILGKNNLTDIKDDK